LLEKISKLPINVKEEPIENKPNHPNSSLNEPTVANVTDESAFVELNKIALDLFYWSK
jgi:hypothetical protein